MPEDPTELATVFLQLGRQAGTIANVAESWARPDGFTRPAWDAEGMFGENAHLGDWRKLAGLSAERRQLFERTLRVAPRSRTRPESSRSGPCVPG